MSVSLAFQSSAKVCRQGKGSRTGVQLVIFEGSLNWPNSRRFVWDLHLCSFPGPHNCQGGPAWPSELYFLICRRGSGGPQLGEQSPSGSHFLLGPVPPSSFSTLPSGIQLTVFEHPMQVLTSAPLHMCPVPGMFFSHLSPGCVGEDSYTSLKTLLGFHDSQERLCALAPPLGTCAPLCHNYFVPMLSWRPFISFPVMIFESETVAWPLAPTLTRGLNWGVAHSPL